MLAKRCIIKGARNAALNVIFILEPHIMCTSSSGQMWLAFLLVCIAGRGMNVQNEQAVKSACYSLRNVSMVS